MKHFSTERENSEFSVTIDETLVVKVIVSPGNKALGAFILCRGTTIASQLQGKLNSRQPSIDVSFIL